MRGEGRVWNRGRQRWVRGGSSEPEVGSLRMGPVRELADFGSRAEEGKDQSDGLSTRDLGVGQLGAMPTHTDQPGHLGWSPGHLPSEQLCLCTQCWHLCVWGGRVGGVSIPS